MPSAADYDPLHNLGVRLVLNMRFARRLPVGLLHPPMEVLWLRTLDNPIFPIPLKLLMQGTRAALATIAAGGKVYTHCAYGRHRSVAMGAAILIAQGHAPSGHDAHQTKTPASRPRCVLHQKPHPGFCKTLERLSSKPETIPNKISVVFLSKVCGTVSLVIHYTIANHLCLCFVQAFP